jgi:hypothetical protein
MGFPRYFFSLTILLFIFISHISFSQIVFKELPGYKMNFAAGPLETVSQRYVLSGNREKIRWQASQGALDLARRMLMRM